MNNKLKFEIGLTSGTLKELNNIIEKFSKKLFIMELLFNDIEDNETIFSLYANYEIDKKDDRTLLKCIDFINEVLENESSKGETILHYTLKYKDSKILEYHYSTNETGTINIIDAFCSNI